MAASGFPLVGVTDVSQGVKGKGKCSKGAVPPPPAIVKGTGKGVGNESANPDHPGAKGKGKCGKGAVPPPPTTMKGTGKGKSSGRSLSQEIALRRSRAAKPKPSPKWAACLAELEEQKVTRSEPGLPVKLIARLMDGREVVLNVKSNDPGMTVKQELSSKLEGISASRLKLIVGTTVFHDFQLVSDTGVSDGDEMSVLILSPLHGALHRSGLEVPVDVQESKMELNDAFAEIAKQRLLRVA